MAKFAKTTPYDFIQFIGFRVRTGIHSDYVPSGMIFNNIPYPSFIKDMKYVGIPDQTKDVDQRLATLQDGIEKAFAGADPSPTILKIFVTPEFFFQPPSGYYDYEHTQKIIGSLKKMVEDNKFKNWHFIFGSIIGDGRGLQSFLTTVKSTKIDNLVMQLQGGVGAASFQAFKANVSPIDFLSENGKSYFDTNTAGQPVIVRIRHPKDTLKYEDVKKISKVAYEYSVLSQVDGLDYGVEICLDHAVGVMRNSFKMTAYGRPIVHIITSCGMNIMAQNVCARPGGYVFLCDGIAPYTILARVDNKSYSQADPAPFSSFESSLKNEIDSLPFPKAQRGGITFKSIDFKVNPAVFQDINAGIDIYSKQSIPATNKEDVWK